MEEEQYLNSTARNGQIRKGAVWFTPSADSASKVIDDPTYFDVDFTIVWIDYNELNENGFRIPSIYGEEFDTRNKTLSSQIAQEQRFWPDIWYYADAFAKVAYSTALTDLGQNKPDVNIAINPTLLQEYSSKFKESFWQPNETYRLITNARPGPATDDYDTLKATTGPLGTTPSVISTQYLCTVPQRKSGGNLFVSILVADIVFLQVIWKLFTMIVDWTALKRVTGAEHCEGCRLPIDEQVGAVSSSAYKRLTESSEPLAADTSGIELVPVKAVHAVTERVPRMSVSERSLDQEGLLR